MIQSGLCDACAWFALSAILSTYNCLVRSDYNLVVALSCYAAWSYSVSKMQPQPTALLITLIILVSEIYDVVWVILVWDSWSNGNTNSVNWNSMVELHDSVILSSVINIFVKLVIICMIQCEKTTILDRMKEKQ